MEEVRINCMPGHCRRLADGDTITIKPDMIGSGIPIMVHPMTAKKIRRAKRLGKGVRIKLSPQEVEMSGGKISWKQFKRGLKTGWDFYKKHIKPIVGPLIRKGLKTAVEKGLPALGTAIGAPEIALATPELSKAVDKIGDATGGFGVKEDIKKVGTVLKKVYKRRISPTLRPLITKELQRGARAGSKYLAKKLKMPSIESYGEVFAEESIPALERQIGYGLYLAPPPVGYGLYMSGGAVLPPSNFLPYYSSALANVADVGNAQYGQKYIRLP
jgi:hypothetical protein